jgi:transcriptional regulator with XRE-family HTH domain
MGNSLPDMSRFRERISRERKRRGWSQAEVADKLNAMGIDSMYNTTVAKIEAGDRDIKLDEAVALARLYDAPLDTLVGLGPNSGRDLDYLLDALSDVVLHARTELDRTGRSLRDRMEDIPSDYDLYDALADLVGEVASHLDAAGKGLDKLMEHHLQYIERRAREQVLAERMVKRPKKQDRA